MKEKRKQIKKLLAFTLAEVLITLSILGVVAAITVPSLVKRNEERSTVAKALKNYSTLVTQADIMIAEYGAPPKWWVNDLYKKLNYTKFCSENNQGCALKTRVKFLNGTFDWYIPDVNGAPTAILKDGTVLATFGLSATCEATRGTVQDACFITSFDINGPKAPNQLGRDIFQVVVSKNGVFPDDTDDCRLTDIGSGCASYLLKNKNMNYLHE